jgi:glycosyltransferase involved in cell wall biosynthesis
VLFFSNLFPTAEEIYRGLDNATLLHELARDFEVRVLSPRPVLPWGRKEFQARAQDGVFQPQWVPAAYLPKIGSPVNHLLMAASMRHHMGNIVRDFKPDAVLGSWIYPDCCAAQHILHGRVPLVAVAQGSDLHHYLQIPVRRRVILKYMPHAAAVVTRSGELARLLREAGFPGDKLRTIYNGVSLETFRPRDQGAARRKYFLPQEARVILFVGNFFKVKNPHHLVLAMGQMKTPGCVLVMAGGGPLEVACREVVAKFHLAERVIFAGRKSPAEIAELMNAADVLALPSQNEGVPNVILEAFASGLPVVASQVGGIPEVLNEERLGRVFPSGDVGALAAALDAQLAATRDVEGIRRTGERYSWGAAAAQYRETLLAAIDHSPRLP